jgi:hypothetical protein
MKVLVCGPRVWLDQKPIQAVLQEFPEGTIVVHGGARGADIIAGFAAEILGFEVRPYPVNPKLDGPWPAAGIRRNLRMLRSEHPCKQDGCFIDVGLAFKLEDTLSKGTAHMASIMRVEETAIVVREILYRAGRVSG